MKNNLNYYISIYFKDYMPNVSGVSRNTILSYRDTFSLLLIYLRDIKNKNIDMLKIEDLNYDIVIDFLLYLEKERKNCEATRNQRLSAIHSFCNFLKIKELSYLDMFAKVLSIPFKKAPKNNISYFSKNEISILINMPDTTVKLGFRDYVLLLTLYETAARAQELADLKRNQIQFKEDISFITLIGKGRKARNIPINLELTTILKKYLQVFNIQNDGYVFTNRQNGKITTKGIEFILLKYVDKARKEHSDKFKLNYSNHCIRHSKAMHLLESGVNLVYIRDFLGHASVITTEIYAKANPITKAKQIIENASNINSSNTYSDSEKENMLDFLKTL